MARWRKTLGSRSEGSLRFYVCCDLYQQHGARRHGRSPSAALMPCLFGKAARARRKTPCLRRLVTSTIGRQPAI
jgi:hypothetical protein